MVKNHSEDDADVIGACRDCLSSSDRAPIISPHLQETNNEMVVADILPDWSREKPSRFWDPPRRLLRTIRRYQKHRLRKGLFGLAISKVAVVEYRFWSIVTGADIPLNGNIGGGLLLPHPNGIVIHPSATIGVNCLIYQQVTIGDVYDAKGPPIIEGHVYIGAGAKVLGPIRIGAHAKIGANAVVLTDVPPGATAVGVPARISKVR
jgi:serine O-acetyltransferase